MCARRTKAARGFTLIELVLAIVIIGISVVAIMSVFIVTAQHSADPMTRQQAQLIAEAYLDEILIKRFYDPDTNNVCPVNEGGGPNLPTDRDLYDNVCDYNTLPDTDVRDQAGTAIAALSAYGVVVAVDSSVGVSLNGVDNSVVTRVLLVTVTVNGPNNTTVALSGYRTNYECNAAGDPECK